MPVLEGVKILPVVMLRHPIDRVGSVYEFQVRQESSTPGAVHAKKMTFEHYVRWGMDPTSGATIRDFQTRRCCGRFVKTRARVTEQDFALALQQVQGIRLLGLVDRYDESMVLFEQVLQPFFPAINLAYVKHNVSTSRRGTLQERVQHVYDRLGAEVGAILQENNYWDQKLYEEAEALLSKRMAAFPDFENKLKDFRERCRRLRILTFGKRFIRTWWTGIKARYPDR